MALSTRRNRQFSNLMPSQILRILSHFLLVLLLSLAVATILAHCLLILLPSLAAVTKFLHYAC